MTKKLLKKKLQRKPAVRQVAAPVVESAREIWLAGLGAFNVAQQESGRIIEQGSKLFDRLVSEGSKVEKKTRKEVEGAVTEIRGEVENRVESMKQQADAVRKQATDNWDKLEKIFEDRVARALASMGIPSKDDVNGLAEKVQKLATQVTEMDRKAVAPKAKTAKKAAKKAAPKATPKAASKAPAKVATKAQVKVPLKKAAARKPAVRKVPLNKVTRVAPKTASPAN